MFHDQPVCMACIDYGQELAELIARNAVRVALALDVHTHTVFVVWLLAAVVVVVAFGVVSAVLVPQVHAKNKGVRK